MSITVITGPMFAGKTTSLLQFGAKHAQTLYIKHTIDTRYVSDTISTHDGVQHRAFQTNDLSTIDIEGIDAICIDEGQFFTNLEVCCEQCAHAGIHVYVAGLISNKTRGAFTNMLNLLPKADQLIFLRARCQCGRPASFTKAHHTGEDFVVGGADIYSATCRRCFNINTEHPRSSGIGH